MKYLEPISPFQLSVEPSPLEHQVYLPNPQTPEAKIAVSKDPVAPMQFVSVSLDSPPVEEPPLQFRYASLSDIIGSNQPQPVKNLAQALNKYLSRQDGKSARHDLAEEARIHFRDHAHRHELLELATGPCNRGDPEEAKRRDLELATFLSQHFIQQGGM